jgi:hypothetical protein
MGMEEEHLALADRHIALGRAIVERQSELIDKLKKQGQESELTGGRQIVLEVPADLRSRSNPAISFNAES